MTTITRRRLLLVAAAGVASTPALLSAASAQSTTQSPTMASAPAMSAPDFVFDGLKGGKIDLADYRGKVVMVVNTASECAFTPQYKGLEAIYRKYEPRGFVVIGVPSNDFGGQEPGSNAEIAGFCCGTYDVTFPMATKAVVTGPSAHPFYRYALATLGPVNGPKWNFHKYLIGRDGRLITAFPSGLEPESPRVTLAIEAALRAPGS